MINQKIMTDKYLHNNKILKSRRKELRVSQTEAEKLIWYKVRNRQIVNLKFFRQYSLGPHILDFYCPEIKLAIELDGGRHSREENKLYDKDRTKYLSNFGVKVIRFWNDEVLKNLEEVLERIQIECHNSLNPSYLKREGRYGFGCFHKFITNDTLTALWKLKDQNRINQFRVTQKKSLREFCLMCISGNRSYMMGGLLHMRS